MKIEDIEKMDVSHGERIAVIHTSPVYPSPREVMLFYRGIEKGEKKSYLLYYTARVKGELADEGRADVDTIDSIILLYEKDKDQSER